MCLISGGTGVPYTLTIHVVSLDLLLHSLANYAGRWLPIFTMLTVACDGYYVRIALRSKHHEAKVDDDHSIHSSVSAAHDMCKGLLGMT